MALPHEWHGAGDPVVLISGLGAKGTSWQPFLSRLASTHRVLTFDNPGSGRSPALRGPVSIRSLAHEALALLDELGVGPAAVVGRSMGGMIAQELALLAPERVTRLVLSSTTARCDVHLASVFELWATMAERGVPAALRHRSSLLWCLGGRALRHDERVRSYLDARSRFDRPADYALQARACAAHDALDRLGRLAVPTLVIAGGDDRLMPTHHAETLAKAIPGSETVQLPDAGHLAYLEAPDRFAAAVASFLASSLHRGGRGTCPIARTTS
jgi:pimeloyl-ACP methyl ester carboxylesterase